MPVSRQMAAAYAEEKYGDKSRSLQDDTSTSGKTYVESKGPEKSVTSEPTATTSIYTRLHRVAEVRAYVRGSAAGVLWNFPQDFNLSSLAVKKIMGIFSNQIELTEQWAPYRTHRVSMNDWRSVLCEFLIDHDGDRTTAQRLARLV